MEFSGVWAYPDPDLYPGVGVLRNKIAIRDAAALERMERLLVAQRTAEGCAPDRRFVKAGLAFGA